MAKQQKEAYQDAEAWRKIIKRLKGQKFRLDFRHYVTIRNGNEPVIICSQCGY